MINYQAPQGGSVYQHAASNFSPANASLIGHEEALGMQQTLQNQRLLFQGGQEAQMEAARVQAAAAMQERHAELQVWAHGQEMTQAEQMQLRQDQNAIAWVNSQVGKTLTQQEADDFIASKRMKVDRGKQKLQQEELKQRMQQTAHVEWQNKLLSAAYDHQTESADGKRAVVIHKDFLEEAAQYARDRGLDPATPEGKAAMEGYAVAQQKADLGWTKKDGSIEPDRAPKGAGATGESGKGGSLDANHHKAALETQLKAVDALAKEKNDDGSPKHPELQDAQARIDAAKLRADAVTGYVSEKIGSGKAAAEKVHQEQLGSVQVSKEAIDKQTDLPPGLRQAQKDTLGQIETMLKRYPPGKGDEHIRARIKALQDKFDQLVSLRPGVRDVPPTKITPGMVKTEGGQTLADQIGSGVRGLIQNYKPQGGGGGGY
jgi:hypothetical protein